MFCLFVCWHFFHIIPWKDLVLIYWFIHYFFMSHTDPPSVTGMRLVGRSSTSLSLSWSVSRRANPSTIRYKLMYCEKVRSRAISDHNFDHHWVCPFNKLWYFCRKKMRRRPVKHTLCWFWRRTLLRLAISLLPQSIFFKSRLLALKAMWAATVSRRSFQHCQKVKPMEFYSVFKSCPELAFL